MKNIALNMQRVLAAMVLLVAFLVMASVISPDSGQAAGHADDHHADGHHADHAAHDHGSDAHHHDDASHAHEEHADEHESHASEHAHGANDHHGSKAIELGSIEGRDHIARILSTDDGPRYTIIDAHSHEILAELITAEEVSTLFPEIPLDVTFEPGTETLMLAEPTGFPYNSP
ncbi:MAG: hypothetical protein AAF432_05775 [Planctomycetota bacterium]